jgi:hypothetical protein
VTDPNYFERMAATNAVRIAYWRLPERVHGADPRDAYARLNGALISLGARVPGHDEALQLAALATALVASLDRAETADITSGGEAA